MDVKIATMVLPIDLGLLVNRFVDDNGMVEVK